MIDPQRARAVLKEYYATASDQQIVDDLWRFSPELARRLNVAPPGEARRTAPKTRKMWSVFSSLRRSVLRLFS
jgi:hypothetical protein